MKRAALTKDYMSVCCSAPSEILAIIAIRQYPKIIKSRMEIINRNLDYCDKLFTEYSDIFEWHRPTGGTVSFLKIKGWLTKLGSGGATGFAEALLENKGLLMAPGYLFSVEGDYLRLGFGRQNFIDMAKILRDFVVETKIVYSKSK